MYAAADATKRSISTLSPAIFSAGMPRASESSTMSPGVDAAWSRFAVSFPSGSQISPSTQSASAPTDVGQ
jgi:hypothetical protein